MRVTSGKDHIPLFRPRGLGSATGFSEPKPFTRYSKHPINL